MAFHFHFSMIFCIVLLFLSKSSLTSWISLSLFQWVSALSFFSYLKVLWQPQLAFHSSLISFIIILSQVILDKPNWHFTFTFLRFFSILYSRTSLIVFAYILWQHFDKLCGIKISVSLTFLQACHWKFPNTKVFLFGLPNNLQLAILLLFVVLFSKNYFVLKSKTSPFVNTMLIFSLKCKTSNFYFGIT